MIKILQFVSCLGLAYLLYRYFDSRKNSVVSSESVDDFGTHSSSKFVPIIYRDEYNIRLRGLEKLHPFDTQKYMHIHDFLLKNESVTSKSFVSPEMISKDQLLKVHTQDYLDSLHDASKIAQIAELDALKYLPLSVLENNMLVPMLYATGGTVLAVKEALKHGFAINLSGGYHHAQSDQGGGWCYYNDVMIAVMENRDLKIMIIDLDAHQGNGNEHIKLEHELENVFVLDMYNYQVYPRDPIAKKAINVKLPVRSGVQDEQYLTELKDGLKNAFSQFTPDLVIYNAGSDILSGDSLGRMQISPRGLLKRDQIVINASKSRNVPLVYLLSGGYQKNNARIISDSILNLIHHFSQ